jgi:DNA-binding transcriptional ArsR family regulator
MQGNLHVMKRPPPALLPLLRSPFQGELLAWLYLHPDQEFSATELATRCAVSGATVTREADRMTAAGLVSERRNGNMRLLRARLDHALVRPLTDLLALTYGPTAVLGEALSHVEGIEEAMIYGSWAARYRGDIGLVPNDVDILIVGDADEDELYDAAREAEHDLGRPVNIRRIGHAMWHRTKADPFVASVRSHPTVEITLSRAEP